MAQKASRLLNVRKTASSQKGKQQTNHASLTGFLAGGGEMGKRIRAKDWSKTPLGAAESWPQSLKTIVRIMLTSRQPIWIGWGPDLIKLYNDPYKAIVGGKHPEALGQPASVVWREIWDDIGPRLQTAMQQNEGTYDESLLLLMERYGYQEETYYTFSYSPVPGDHGDVEGIICANTDDTQRIIGERQLKLLRTLAAETTDARTIEAACCLSATSLEQNPYDIPFAMLYLLDYEKQTAYLTGASGIQKGHPAVPEKVALDAHAVWPFHEVMRTGKARVISHLGDLFDGLPTGAWKNPPHQAVILPIAPSGHTGKAGLLLAGLNPFRLYDEGYQGFLNLVAGQIAASIANAQAYEEERKRAEALAEIDRAKTDFFSNVSHEFRTPLTLMLGPIEETLAEKNMLSEAQRERTEILQRNALRLLKLVNTLLDFSRIESGRSQAIYRPTDLAALTADLASSFRSAIEKAGMTLIVDCPSLSQEVYVDHEMWEKIVLNLLSNAFKYTFTGSITVSLRQKETAVELSIQDTGVGIPAEELPHMFERFHRVRGIEGRTHEGTGIGLSLVQGLVKLHGGNMRVESTPGKGSTFTITLPLGTAHLPQERVVAQQFHPSVAENAHIYVEEALHLLGGEQATSLISDGRNPLAGNIQPEQGEQRPAARILFADDNADMRAYVSRLLYPRYSVQVVPDGEAALAAVKESHPDLVLADVMMPGMDGFALLAALRSDQQTRNIPIVLLSARAGEEAQIEGITKGADDYLIKPFSARELLAHIGAHLDMARVRREAEERIKAEQRNKDDFIGIASHELKTPVTSLKAYAQLLEWRFRQGGDARSAELLQKMDAQLDKLMSLIGDLLDVTKIENGQLLFQHTSFDFNELINEIVEEIQRTTTRHTIRQELAPSVTLFADRDRIGQVLTNLLTNAIKYSPQAETVVVKTVCAGDAIITSVQDFGIGIPGEKQQHIFERFFRVGGETRNTYPGLGLGLYISAEFVKRHGGSIRVESEEGKGTTFSFSLPLRQTQEEVNA